MKKIVAQTTLTLLLLAGCSGKWHRLDEHGALNLDIGGQKKLLLYKSPGKVQIVVFNKTFDELGINITESTIEIQRKTIVGNETILTISDSPTLAPTKRYYLNEKGNIKRFETFIGDNATLHVIRPY